MRDEIEDGFGCSGLVPTKAEREQERAEFCQKQRAAESAAEIARLQAQLAAEQARHKETEDIATGALHGALESLAAQQVLASDATREVESLRERLFSALKTDEVLARALQEVDHSIDLRRSTLSAVMDAACAQKARADAAEALVLELADALRVLAVAAPNCVATYRTTNARKIILAAIDTATAALAKVRR